MDRTEIVALAKEMASAQDECRFVLPPTQRFQDLDLPTAYLIAAEVHELRRARGQQHVGRKIGWTNRDIWAEYGVDHPVWDFVFAHTVQYAAENTAQQSLATMVAPRIEPEIAFKLGAPLEAGCTDPAVILRSVEWMARTFEIVDCHYAGWRLRGADSVIDFGHHAALIIGEPREIAAADVRRLVDALRDCEVSLRRSEEVIERGRGANALGHPALALAHLVDLLASQPHAPPLAAGEVVTTGTLTAPRPIAAGETWSTDTDGLDLPTLTVEFA